MSHEVKSDMDTFISLAKTLAKDTDEAGRKKVLDTLRDLAYSIESPEDTIQRIMFYVRSCVRATIGHYGLTPMDWSRTFNSQVSA